MLQVGTAREVPAVTPGPASKSGVSGVYISRIAAAVAAFIFVTAGVHYGLQVFRPQLYGARSIIAVAAADPLTNTVFLGPSHVQNGFDPGAFDAATSSLGISTHSWNLGQPDALTIEDIADAEALLRCGPLASDTSFSSRVSSRLS